MNKKILLLIVSTVILLGVFSFLAINYQLEIKESQRFAEISSRELGEQQITYIIDKGEGDVSQYQIREISEEATIFSLLEELGQKENFEIETTQYSFGIFVESINGVKNGQNNKYWLYWVNDKLGEVAADKKKVELGDKIEWKFVVPPEFQ